jgi:predicted DNA-binding protein
MTELSIKLKDKLAKKIYKISKDTNTNSSVHINKALENYIDELEDLNIALKRLKDESDSVVSSKQLRKSLGF